MSDAIRPSHLPLAKEIKYPIKTDKSENTSPIEMNEDMFPETICIANDMPQSSSSNLSLDKSEPEKRSTKKRTAKTKKGSGKKDFSPKRVCEQEDIVIITTRTVHYTLKPPPSVEWKRKAISCLQRYTPIQIIDKLSNPDCINSIPCSEISPHIRDGVVGDGNCGFRAIAKQLTGTESNHPVIRAAIVQYMYDSNVNRTTHSIITSATVLTLTVIFIQPK